MMDRPRFYRDALEKSRWHWTAREVSSPRLLCLPLWQNRFFACMLAPSHLRTAIVYVERNPIRARIVRRAGGSLLW